MSGGRSAERPGGPAWSGAGAGAGLPAGGGAPVGLEGSHPQRPPSGAPQAPSSDFSSATAEGSQLGAEKGGGGDPLEVRNLLMTAPASGHDADRNGHDMTNPKWLRSAMSAWSRPPA